MVGDGHRQFHPPSGVELARTPALLSGPQFNKFTLLFGSNTTQNSGYQLHRTCGLVVTGTVSESGGPGIDSV